MADHDPTLDPKTQTSRPGTAAPRLVPALRVLYHGDLSRVGAQTLPGALTVERPVPIGRRNLSFASADGSLAALDDPCISRHQCTVRWHPWHRELAVASAPQARRRVFVGPDRQLAEGQQVPPGTLIEIEDRVLLWFDLVPVEPLDAMGMVGASAAINMVRQQIAALAPAAPTVLVRGETGVGKELVVRALHAGGARPDGPLVALNCGAMPAHLMESELFGHERGAFTGADRARAGLFEQAAGGTLFLDELGELPPGMQAALLRVLQERRVRRVGGSTERSIEVRVVAATHRDLAAEVAAGRFREDLYARIERPELLIPPLRDRREDVPLLFAAFLAERRRRGAPDGPLARLWRPVGVERSSLPCGWVRALMHYDWPRNVRELDLLAEDIAVRLEAGLPLDDPPGAVTLAPAPRARARSVELLDAEAGSITDHAAPTTAPMRRPGDERPSCTALEAALRGARWSPSAAARHLGVARNTVYAWMADCNLPRATDYDDAAIVAAVRRADGALAPAADALRISLRALKLRLAAIDS